MDRSVGEFERLIAERLLGIISPQDDAVLDRWIHSSEQNKALYDALYDRDRLFFEAGRMAAYHTDVAWGVVVRKRRVRFLRRIAIPFAAALVLAVLLVGYPWRGQEPVQEQQAATSVAAVKLYMASGEVMVVDSVRSIALRQSEAVSDNEGLVMHSRGREAGKAAFCTIETPAQKHFWLTLEDGTRVMVNASTTLRFPERFGSRGAREVYLDGEAYFAVAKDNSRPFIVHSAQNYVRVTGTTFNIKAYSGSENLYTTLVEGSVRLGSRRGVVETELVAGMQAIESVSKGTVVTHRVDVAEYTAWMNDLFLFRNKPLGQIMEDVGRWYGCKIHFVDPLRSESRFTGKISRSSSIEELVEYFGSTLEMKIALNQGTIEIK